MQVGLTILPIFFAVGEDGRILVSCGHWDNSFKVSLTDNGRTIQSISQHKGARWLALVCAAHCV